jgi:cell division protein FtsA
VKVFDLPVRIGRPSGISGISEALDSPVYATGAGLALYGQRMRKEGRVSRFKRRGRIARGVEQVREWLAHRF